MIKHLFASLFITVASCANFVNGQQCADGAYTLNPPPVDGQYQSGQTVEVCVEFDYEQTSVDWVHGIVPIIPEGWNMSSINITPPPSCSGSGTWGWYESVTSSATGNSYGPGLFYDQYNDGNPGNNYGDNLFSCGYSFSFCLTITTADCNSGDLDGANMNLQFQVLGDNFSGSWGAGGNSCPPSANTILPLPSQNASLNCCSGEDAILEVCSTDGNQMLFDLFSSSPSGGTWQNPSGSVFSGVFIPGSSADGVYAYLFDTGDCAAESTVEVTTYEMANAGTGQNVEICASADPVNLFDQIIGGEGGGTWTDPGGNPTTGTYTPGTSPPGAYTYSVGDGTACPQSQTIVNVSEEAAPNAGDNGYVTLCESDPQVNLFNFLMNAPETGGFWADPLGNPHSGLLSPTTDIGGDYTYTVGTAPCVSSATVNATIINLPYAGEDTSVEVCEDGVTLNMFLLLPGADDTGFWANPNGEGFDGFFEPGIDPIGEYIYQVGGMACNDIAVVTVSLADTPSGTISATNSYCQGSEVDIELTLDGIAPFDVIYSVNGTEYSLSNINSGYIETVSGTGDLEIELISISDNTSSGCTGSGNSILVELIPTPSAVLSGGGGICEGADAILDFELSGEGPFDVVFTDGAQEFTLNNINNGHSEIVTPSENTTYTLVSVNDNSSSSCTGNVSGSASFAVNEAPSGSISGNANICVGESTEITFNLEGDGPFDVTYTNGADNFSLTGIEDGHTVSVSPPYLSFYQLESVISQGNPNCSGTTSGMATITVSAPPVYDNLSINCNEVNEGYVVSFNISGGDPDSYEVTGDSGELTGNVFTSDEIPSGSEFTFFLDDENGCGPVEISGQYTCDCTTNAGTLENEEIEICSSETAVATHMGNEILDPNDALIFVLHDSPYYTASTILAENDIPEFTFLPEMEFNTTYYITAVAGNATDGSVDHNDQCLSASSSISISFIESPSAEITGSGTICPGEMASLEIELTGTAPWTVEYALDGESAGSIISNSNSYVLDVNEAGSYSLIEVTDAFCTGNASGEVEVSEYDSPSAIITDGGDFCAGSGGGPEINLTGTAPWTVTYTIDGTNAETVEISDTPFAIEASISGTYEIIDVSDVNCTGTGSGSVAVTVHELPTATIGGGGQICEGDNGTIEFSGSGSGDLEVVYAIDGEEAGTVMLTVGTATLSTDEAGIYSIVNVTDDFCSNNGDGSTAEILVNPIPTAEISLEPAVLCEGDSALLSITTIGNGPFDLIYSVGGEMMIADNTSEVHEYVYPANGQEFSLISITDNSDPACGQDLDQSITAQVLLSPEVPNLTDVMGCNNDTLEVGVDPQPNLSYTWSPQIGLSNSTISNPVLTLENTSSTELTTVYTLFVSNGVCDASSEMEVTVFPDPQVDFSYAPDPVSTEATSVNFYNHTNGQNQYTWLIDSNIVSTNTHMIYTFPEGIEARYLVTLSAENQQTGCTSSMTQVVDVVGELILYVPNAFTPNGDGVNDLFGPVISNYRPNEYEFIIFNRQGEQVFRSTSPEDKWDGSEPGLQHYAQNMVYVWLLKTADDYSSATEELKGSVTVVR